MCFLFKNLKLVSVIFYQIFIFHQIMVLQKLWNMFFYFIKKALFVLEIFKFLYFLLPLFFPVNHCLRGWSKKSLKIYDVINCLKKNLITYFVWYLEREIRCDIEVLSINRELNKEHFYVKIMQKICFKS